MKEQLERMFPWASIGVIGLIGQVRTNGVEVMVLRHPGDYTSRANVGHFSVARGCAGRTVAESLAKLREDCRRESVMAPTKTARARAARVLRVLDAAKLGEVAP